MSRRALQSFVLSALLCATLGCSEGSSGVPCIPLAADAGDLFPCEVDQILEAKCRRCHNTQAVLDVCYPQGTCLRGPFPLVEWSDTRRDLGDGRVVYEHMIDVVASGYMPFQTPDVQPPVQPLTEAEKAALLGWLQSGAPRRACECSGAP
jgi:hypothetical protein